MCALVVVGFAASVACSDESGPSKPKPQPKSPFANYSIKIFSGAEQRRVDVPPLPERGFRVPSQLLRSAEKQPAGLGPFKKPQSWATQSAGGTSKPLATIETPDGGVETPDDLSTPIGWALVYGAAYECGMGGSSFELRNYPKGQTPVFPPWTGNAHFIFPDQPTFCDQQTAYEEALLCIADKLAEVAEAPMPLSWTNVPATPTTTGMPAGPWRIPPQATKDRFVARDIAMHVLSLIGFTDLTEYATPPGATQTMRTCARAYGEAAAVTGTPPAGVLDNYYNTVFGVGQGTPSPYLPPVGTTVTQSNFSTLAKSRMLFKAHVLRAAARLLHDQIDKGLAADMAGAEQQRALATDPDRGARLMWGAETESTQPYNSLAHATRLLSGRLETGYLDQTSSTCSEVSPMGLLSIQGLGPEYEARFADRGVTTKDQEIAAKLIDQAGIVVPESTALSGSMTDLRQAVEEQLVANAGAIHGIPAGDPDFVAWGEGKAIQVMVEGLADEDIRFALMRSASAYRQLTSTARNGALDWNNPGGGMTAQGTVTSLRTLVGGLAIDGGIPRRDLTVPFTARLGGIQTATQCEEADPETGAILADTGKIVAFQNPYFVGDTLRKRLIALREEADLVFDSTEDVVEVPNGGAVEIRTWAGPGRVVLRADGSPMATIGMFLIGFNPEDFAVTTPTQVADEVVLVHGPPWVADCAARIRTSCPENFEQDYILRHDTAVVHSNNDPATYGLDRSWARTVGSDGTVIELTFDVTNAPQNFVPDYIASDNPVERLYIVARHNPVAPTGGGRVLGSATPKSNGGQIALAVSVHQAEKNDDTVGVDPGYDTQPFLPYDDGGNSSTPPNYCEFEREPFVPLENELTSDSDQYESSWRHYLQLAKEAAARADELGQKLIDLGFQKDLRREAAGEELAEICGDYSALDEVPFDTAKGTVGKSASDKGLNTCLNEKRFDVVFLTSIPKALDDLTTEQQKTDWIRANVLKCSLPVHDENPLCDSVKHPQLTFDGLGITEHADSNAVAPSQCNVAGDLMATIGPNKAYAGYLLQDIANEPWVSGAAFRAILTQSELRIAESGSWKLLYAGAEVMNSEPPPAGIEPLWPYCTNALLGVKRCTHEDPGANADPLAVHFDRLFRSDLVSYSAGNGASKMRLLWRVQGALWMLGGLADEVPAGLFNGYVPAARLNNNGAWGAEDLVPLPAVYAEGNYAATSNPPNSYQLNFASQGGFQLTDSDIKLIGAVREVDPNFDYTFTTAQDWIKLIYSQPSRYLHVPARSKAYTRSFPPLVPKAKTPELGDSLGVWLIDRGWELHDMQCPAPYGSASNGGSQAKYAKASDAISNIKLDYFECDPRSTATSPEPSLRIVYSGKHVDWNLADMNVSDCSGSVGATGEHVAANKQKCVYGGIAYSGFGAKASMKRPSVCSPDERFAVFLNSNTKADRECSLATELTQALGVGCALAAKGLLPAPTEQPSITSVADIPKLERWLGEMEKFSSTAASRLYLQHVPERVVKDFREGSVGTGSLKGTHGQLVLELESAVQQLGQAWPQMAGRFKKIRATIEGARLQLKTVELQQKIEEEQLVIARWQAHAAMAHALAEAVSAFQIGVGFNPVGGVAKSNAAAVSAAAYIAELEAYEKIEQLQGDLAGTNTALVLNTLEENTSTLYAEAAVALIELRKTTASAAALSEALRYSELKAQYKAAMGAGASFMVSDGDVVEFPVNIVLNRQYDVTKIRYEAALKEARYLAYVAQIAVEQRLGRRLSSFSKEMGPLDAPAKWGPTLCSLSGVNYENLRDVVVPDGGFKNSDGGLESASFADMFIGDWVDKLTKFVEFYNMEYPSHDGDDVAVISLRDELLGPAGACTKPSPNLILYSSELTSAHSISDASGAPIVSGWVRRPCGVTDAHCLQLAIAETLNPPPEVPEEGGALGGMTWLHEVTATSITDPAELSLISATQSPARIVYQQVTLEAKTYTLSWWDQGRDATGAPGAAPSYPVTIYDAQWTPVETQVNTPHVPDASKAWERRKLPFTTAAAGLHYVAFAASDTSGPGNVVIANVQLEGGSSAGPYQANGASSLVLDTSCASGNPTALQQAFQYECDLSGSCYYELAAPFSISTYLLDSGASNLVGKVAKDNFNYRHINVALNLVGSGVLDCALEPSSSCYGSGYVEYTLGHEAFDVEVLSHEKPKEAQHFNFGLGSINRGKALAAERFITLPMGSADQALLAQPAFEKTEYMGRPLDGSYMLRIYDRPSLQWNRVEDVQFVLKYRYWSRIQPYPSP